MNCLCPKCSKKIDLDPSQVPQKGDVSHSCPECSLRYLLSRESFARRAYRRSAEICCVKCGSQLSHSLHCPSCRTLYPEYLVAEFPDAAKKRARQKKDLFGQLKNFSFQLRKPADTGGYKPARREAKPEQPGDKRKKLLLGGVSLLIIVALAISGVILNQKKKARKQYAEAYVMALYGIKLGADTGLKTSSRLAADWKARNDAGQTGSLRPAADEEAKLTKQKAQTDKNLQKLKEPPEKFIKAGENLNKLYAAYLKIYSASLNPSGAPASFADSLNRMENEFKQVKEELKKDLPEELAAMLKTAKTNFKAMSDF